MSYPNTVFTSKTSKDRKAEESERQGAQLRSLEGTLAKYAKILRGNRLTPNPHFWEFVLKMINPPVRQGSGTWLTASKDARQPKCPLAGGWLNTIPHPLKYSDTTRKNRRNADTLSPGEV